jgi:hypothetical protein
VKITAYHVFIGLMMLLFLTGLFFPRENSYPGMSGDDNLTDNFTNMSQSADQSPLMSTPDNVLSEEKGWWKHEGHSIVSGGNGTASAISGEASGNDDNDRNNGDNNDSEEIPEFPTIVVPFIAIIGISLFFSRK